MADEISRSGAARPPSEIEQQALKPDSVSEEAGREAAAAGGPSGRPPIGQVDEGVKDYYVPQAMVPQVTTVKPPMRGAEYMNALRVRADSMFGRGDDGRMPTDFAALFGPTDEQSAEDHARDTFTLLAAYLTSNAPQADKDYIKNQLQAAARKAGVDIEGVHHGKVSAADEKQALRFVHTMNDLGFDDDDIYEMFGMQNPHSLVFSGHPDTALADAVARMEGDASAMKQVSSTLHTLETESYAEYKASYTKAITSLITQEGKLMNHINQEKLKAADKRNAEERLAERRYVKRMELKVSVLRREIAERQSSKMMTEAQFNSLKDEASKIRAQTA